MLYERSKQHIYFIQDHKTPFLDGYMQLFSFLGDGDFYYFVYVVIWASGVKSPRLNCFYLFNYGVLNYLMVNNYNYIMKSFFNHSRPIFDDITLADTSMKDCATEFGNPSGHSSNSVSFVLTVCFITAHIYKDWFARHPLV